MFVKLIAGVVCGAAAALPGTHMLASIGQAFFHSIMRDPEGLDLALAVMPFAVTAMAIFVCAIAPNALGAWLRGCLLVTVVSIVFALQGVQCFGIELLFDWLFEDPDVRRAAMSGCAEGVTPVAVAGSLALALIFGAGTIVVWRMAKRSSTTDY